MNIFVVDENPVKAAQDLCDKHVVAMVRETAQLLSTALQILNPELEGHIDLYKKTHVNHPCSIWARESGANYRWLCIHGKALADEYTFRYGKVHACTRVIEYCAKHADLMGDGDLTPFAQVVKGYEGPDAVEAYRRLYLKEKAVFAKWAKGRPAPEWFLTH